MPEADQRNPTRAMLALLGLAVVGLALHVAWVSGLARGELNELINHWIYNGVLVLAAAVCVLRAVASPRAALDLACLRARSRPLGGGRHLFVSRARRRQESSVPVARRPPPAAGLSVSIRRCGAHRATASQVHRQRLARLRDRRSCLRGPRNGPARTGVGGPDERRSPRCRDQPFLFGRRHRPARVSDRRHHRHRSAAGADVVADRRRNRTLGRGRRHLPLSGHPGHIQRGLSRLPLARRRDPDRRGGNLLRRATTRRSAMPRSRF